MNQFNLIQRDGVFVVDSREVAEMTNVRHSDLLEKIDGYVGHLLNGKFRSVDFFIESFYQDSTGRTLKCYLLTRKGCDMVANKMTGEKGVLFTAAYVTKFEEMEKKQSLPAMSSIEMIAAIASQAVEQERRLSQHEARIEAVDRDVKSIREVVSLNITNWRNDAADLLKNTARVMGGYEHIKQLREESYRLLDDRFGVSLATRLTNKRRRMADEGVCKSKRDKLNYLDVIAEDKKLIEGYVSIVKDLAVKFGSVSDTREGATIG